MKIEDVEMGHPGPDEVKVRNYAIGVNYTDVYTRRGNETYLRSDNKDIEPFTPGKEGAGIVLEVGENVTGGLYTVVRGVWRVPHREGKLDIAPARRVEF